MSQSKKHKDDVLSKEFHVFSGQTGAAHLPVSSMSGQNAEGHFLAQPLELLLAEGGDPRLAVSPLDNLNVYGCRPSPRPEAITFSSTTASSISEKSYIRAAQARLELMNGSATNPEEEVFDKCIEHIRQELKKCLTLENDKVDVVFSPSGTDGQLIALFIARELLGSRVTSIVVASNETGSGTAFTAKGQHFNTYTAQGVPVRKGEAVAAMADGMTCVDISLRDEKGSPRSAEDVDHAVLEAIETAIASGSKVLLQTMDSSKLGWRSPSRKCLKDISVRWPNDVQVVVDACQMRLGRARIKDYLNRGYIVMLTGSKFFTGPPFSGALLVPEKIAAQMVATHKVPVGLSDYSNRGDWPVKWSGIRSWLPPRLNFGQWLRWEAAVEEMRLYFTVPQADRLASLQKFSVVVTQCIENSLSLTLLPAQPSDPTDDIDDGEMTVRTVFPFFIKRVGKLLSPEDCKKLYQALNLDVSLLLPSRAQPQEIKISSRLCHIGQPVTLHDGAGNLTAALRISAGARTVSEGWSPDDVKAIVDKIEVLLKYFDVINIPEKTAGSAEIKPLHLDAKKDLPRTRLGMVKLTRMAFDNKPLKPLWDELYKQVEADPENAAAMMDMADIAQISGLQANGLVIQSGALGMERLYRLPCDSPSPRLRVLKLAAPIEMGGNTPIEFLFEGSDIELYTLYIVPGVPLPGPLPYHDVAFVAIPDTEAARPALAEVNRLMPHWPRPVLNLPSCVHHLNRDELYTLLKPISKLYIPMTARVPRDRLVDIGRECIPLQGFLEDGVYPLIVRPIDSHAGRGLDKLESAADIDAYLYRHPGAAFFISRYIDYSSTDGLFRKYRIVFINGKAYACHMAISEQWKIWYLNANMALSNDKRAEEDRFLTHFDEDFSARHGAALSEIAKRINLEYFAIDCAETKSGELLIFEAGNTMIVHNMDSPVTYPYKPPQMQKVFTAFVQMIDTFAKVGRK